MKPGDLSVTWRAQLNADGPSKTARAIGEVLLSAGSKAASAIRALELLFVTLSSEQSAALKEAIRADARELRRTYGGEPVERVRLTALVRKKRELEEQHATLAQENPAHADIQRRIESLSGDALKFNEAISRLTNEHRDLNRLRQLMHGD